MQKRSLSLVAAACLVASGAGAHCQIPCGIYDDEARLNTIAEDITTIEKSMNEIRRLSAETPVNYNQVVRWVQSKEDHADKLIDIVTAYFMTQRIKPNDEEGREAYVRQLTLLHGMMIRAMKAKQTTDDAHIVELRRLLGQFREAYLKPAAAAGHEHTHAEHAK